MRFDEITLQKYGINVESFDLSELVMKVKAMDDQAPGVQEKLAKLRDYTDFSAVPEENAHTIAKIGVVIDNHPGLSPGRHRAALLERDGDLSQGVPLRCWAS